MADPWVESLSEDWISQPHSSPLVLPSEGNISHGTPPRSSGTTRIVYGGGGGGRRNSGVDGFSTTNCRPLSFNIGGGDGGSSKDVGGEAGRRGEGGEGARKETPEWKRKVLQDFGGPGGKDLFSPMRLESMFRPPTIGPSSTSTSSTPLAFALPPVHRIQQHQNQQQQQQQRKSLNKKSSIPVPSSPVSKALSRLSEETSSKIDTDSSRHFPSISIASSATTAAEAAVSKQRSTPLMLARRGVGLAHQHQHHHHQSASTSSSGTDTSGLKENNRQQKQNKNKKQAKRKPDTAPAADARNIIKPQTDNQSTNKSRGFRMEGGGKGHSRNDSDEMMKKNEGISPIFTERLKQLREARKKKQLLSSSPERGGGGRFNSTLVEDMTSQVLPTMGTREGDDKQIGEGEVNILGGIKDGSGGGGVRRGGGEKKQKLFFQEVESSVYPSSPPVMSAPLGGVAVQFCGNGCFDEDKSFNDTTDLASTFASPNKLSQAKDGEEEEMEKEYSSKPQLQALPSFTGSSKALLLPPPISQDDITTTTTSSSSSSSFPKANNRGEEEEKNQFPGSGNTIINNIRRHKDAPKSSSASAAAAKANTSPIRAHALLSNPPTQDLFPLHYPLQKKQQNHISNSPQTPPPKKSETSSGLQQGSRSSGSPLKLFHSFYDTYTNEKLRKRLGELEHSVFERGHQKEKQTQAEEESEDEDQEDYEETFAEDESSNISDEGSIVVNRLEKLARKQSRQESIESSRRRKNSKEHVRYSKKTFQKETTATTTTTVAIHRQVSAPNASSRRIGIEEDNSGYRKHRRWKSDESGVNDGITGPKHPVKERTPKRIRRNNSGGQQRKISVKSSRSSEMAGGGRRREPEEGSILMSTSRTRSSALRTNGSRIEENPPITPTHRAVKKFVKREGTPTPGSRGKKKIPVLKLNYQYGDSVQDSPGGPSKSSPKKRSGGYKIFSGSQGDGMAGESFEMPTAAAVGGEMAETETLRKGSVTTQDFLAQAEEVMDRIRGIGLLSTRGKHGNYDGSSFIEDVQEEDEEEEQQQQDEGWIPSTKKESNEKEPGAVFSDNKKRGAFDKWETINRSTTESPGRDMREGTAERGFLLGSSESECDQDDVAPTTSAMDALATGHLSSLRIAEETNSAGSNEEDNGSSQGSLGSRSSMKVVTPVEEVLNHHLATKNTGGLTFDRKAMAWVKRERPASPEKSMDGGDNSSSATEDEDPFQGISDLTVDSQEERRALELARKHWEGMGNDSPSGAWKNSRMVLDDSSIMEVKDGNAGDETWGKERWNTDIGGSSFGSATGLSVRSGFTDARTETRLTSYGSHEEKLARNTRNASNADTSIMEETMVEGNETRDDIDEEGFEDQENVAPSEKQSRRVVSNYTADFSSPTTATMLMQSQNALGDLPEMWNDSLEADTEGNIDGFLDHGSLRQSRRSSKTFSSGGTSYRGAARRRSGGGKTFMGRPVSRITEEEEDNGSLTFSDIEKGLRTMSLSSVLSPLPTPFASHVSIPPPPSTSRKAEVSFHMTSLPDISYQFETTEALIGLELSFIASRRGPKATAKLIEASFSIAQENLVKNLTDVEPYEPYWDYMKYLNIADKNLETLHTLNEWCPRLEELDVSGNQLGQLSGVPENVKDLKVQRNCLSGLTHWGHLLNIQYLNVSGNMLDSLEGLRALRHLRELRADDNCVESLEGVDEIEGLGVLRVRRNRLTAVDLGKAFLNRLTELDLRGNKIESIEGLDNLPALVHLNLDQNRLNDLNIPKGTRLETVRSVKLTHNFFETFDVSQFPNLRILYIDNNSLHYIDGLTRAKHLDAISCREQSPKEPSTPSTLPLERMYEARKIYLSGNPLLSPILSSFKLDFLNLQYLELASAQLTTLPKGFGHFVSNTRVLNLNYNAISDLKGLYGILRLKKLLLVGNRVRSLRKVASILGYFPALGFLDMRMNPLTVGFYPASSVRQSLLPSSSSSDDYPKDPFTMMPGDEEKDRIFQAQMDPDTTATRRRYELTVARKCSRMKELDGLKFRKENLRTDVDGLGVGEAVGGREKGNTASKNTKTNGTQDPVKKMAKKPGSVANTGGGRGGN